MGQCQPASVSWASARSDRPLSAACWQSVRDSAALAGCGHAEELRWLASAAALLRGIGTRGHRLLVVGERPNLKLAAAHELLQATLLRLACREALERRLPLLQHGTCGGEQREHGAANSSAATSAAAPWLHAWSQRRRTDGCHGASF